MQSLYLFPLNHEFCINNCNIVSIVSSNEFVQFDKSDKSDNNSPHPVPSSFKIIIDVPLQTLLLSAPSILFANRVLVKLINVFGTLEYK